MRKTKIVCTLGPASDKPETLKQMMLEGMNVARFNFSHATHEEHLERLVNVRKIRDELGMYVATLLDTKGPEIRIGLFEEGSIELFEGDKFTLTTDDIKGTKEKVSVLYKGFAKDVSVGSRVLFSDGLIEMVVDSIEGTDVNLTVLNNGKLSNNKSINLPGVKLSMPFVSEKDRADIIFGIQNDFDFIALSFTRSKQDVLDVRAILDEYKKTDIRIIAKIENAEGVENLDEILEVVDAVMVARGDMGVEINFTEIPRIQKDMITRCIAKGKPAITATQMLESMTNNPRPTRAEVNDVANAIYDGTSAIMLSGESAAGKYPVEAVKTMAAIAKETEEHIEYTKILKDSSMKRTSSAVSEAICHASCLTAADTKAKAIITITDSGSTARRVSKYRPEHTIIGCTTSEKSCRHLSLSWGVVPVLMPNHTNTDDLMKCAVEAAKSTGIVDDKDIVVITAGVPVGVSGSTNIIKIHTVGEETFAI